MKKLTEDEQLIQDLHDEINQLEDQILEQDEMIESLEETLFYRCLKCFNACDVHNYCEDGVPIKADEFRNLDFKVTVNNDNDGPKPTKQMAVEPQDEITKEFLDRCNKSAYGIHAVWVTNYVKQERKHIGEHIKMLVHGDVRVMIKYLLDYADHLITGQELQ